MEDKLRFRGVQFEDEHKGYGADVLNLLEVKDFTKENKDVMITGIKKLVRRKNRNRFLMDFDEDMGILSDDDYENKWDFNEILHSTEDILQAEIKKENKDLASEYIDIEENDIISNEMRYMKRQLVLENLRTNGE